MKEQVYAHLIAVHNQKKIDQKFPEYVTFQELTEVDNIGNMRLYLNELVKDGRLRIGGTINDRWFEPV